MMLTYLKYCMFLIKLFDRTSLIIPNVISHTVTSITNPTNTHESILHNLESHLVRQCILKSKKTMIIPIIIHSQLIFSI